MLTSFLQRPAWLFSSLGPWVRYFYLVRVQLIALLVLTAMPVLAHQTGLRSLLLGAYDVGSWMAALAVGFVLVMVKNSLRTLRELVDHHGEVRFGGSLAGNKLSAARNLHLAWEGMGWLAVVLNCLVVMAASPEEMTARWILPANLLAGITLALGLSKFIHGRLPQGAWASKMAGSLIYRIFQGVVPGFIEPVNASTAAANNMRLCPGHGAAAVQAVALLTAFIFLPADRLHPLASVLFLISIFSFLLGFMAFFVDRYRAPVVAYLVVFCGLMTLYLESDHYYAIKPRSETSRQGSPAEVLGRAAGSRSGIIVVTAAGGGIQSAAWTTEILHQLGGRFKESSFHQSVRLISGVSGGSVGALHYAHAFSPGKQEVLSGQAANAASASSLHAATLGLIREDLVRALAPWYYSLRKDILRDRGLLLQHEWCNNSRRSLDGQEWDDLDGATLLGWGQEAARLERPAVIFNATITETGERMALSSVPRTAYRPPGLPLIFSRAPARVTGDFEFHDRYVADIEVLTAARLSATFPVVSPAARPAVVREWKENPSPMPGAKHWQVFPDGGHLLHAVDGGYFENSGMIGALEWLQNGLDELVLRSGMQPPDMPAGWDMPREILILELDAFPRDSTNDQHVDRDMTPNGLLADLISPAVTLANVRTSGQTAFSRLALGLFQQAWKGRVDIHHLKIQPNLALPGQSGAAAGNADKKLHLNADWRSPPLSWHLREAEKQAIKAMATAVLDHLLAKEADKPLLAAEKKNPPGTTEPAVQEDRVPISAASINVGRLFQPPKATLEARRQDPLSEGFPRDPAKEKKLTNNELIQHFIQ